MPASPNFCIYGAGAIGGMIATLLARAGATVSVVARGETLVALKRDGLQRIIDGEALQAHVRTSADSSELGPQDYVIISVKAPDLPGVASRIGPQLGPETAIVTAMNGVPWWFFASAGGALAGKRLTAVDPEGSIGRAIPVARAIGCVIYMACAVETPGVIRHSAGRRLCVGAADNRRSSARGAVGRLASSGGFRLCGEPKYTARHLAQAVGQSQHVTRSAY